MDSAVVVIPVYQQNFSDGEWLSLQQTFKTLTNYTICILHPEGLSIQKIQENFECSSIAISPEFFGSIKSYNKLVLSRFFYELFKDYDYMLLCQTDVMVFRDDLKKWIEKDFDYVGAPWYGQYWNIWHNIFLKDGIVPGLKCLFTPNFYNAVGNGGFSLRKISSFLSVFDKLKTNHIPWNSNEDYYWGIMVPEFNVAPRGEAVSFSIETDARKALADNQGKLPFGTHAYEKYKPEFWEPFVKKIRANFN